MKKFAVAAGLALAVGCGDSGVDPTGGGSTGGSDEGAGGTGEGGTPVTDGGGGAGDGGEGVGGTPVTIESINTIAGDATWTVTFDDAAKATGAVDCTYTRHYEGIEDRSAQWLCPACEVMFYATVEMTDGLEDCFSQISPDFPPQPAEWVGYGGGRWWRGYGGPMSDQGSVTDDAGSLATANTVADQEFPAGGFFSFDIAGAFTQGEVEDDPYHGFNVPPAYECGWNKADPPPYEGDYTLVVGETVPDGLFKDKCDQTVRLHDLAGSYLIIDMAARDCPPCRAMAGDEEAWLESMAAQGVDVKVVTLLAPALDDTLGLTTTTMLNSWTNAYDITSPVLADRGWGLTMFLPVFGEEVGYPSLVIVDPDLQVLYTQNGYGAFDEGNPGEPTIESIILDDAN